MSESLRWIIILAGGWEPSEEEQTQFIAEVADYKFPDKYQNFSYVPMEYMQEEDIEIFDDYATTFAAFATVPDYVLNDENIMPYLRSEMPAMVKHNEINGFKIFWEPFEEYDEINCYILWVMAEGLKLNLDEIANKPRKMVQQVKRISKDKKKGKRRSLSGMNKSKFQMEMEATMKRPEPKSTPNMEFKMTPLVDEPPRKKLVAPIKSEKPAAEDEWNDFLGDLGDTLEGTAPPEAPTFQVEKHQPPPKSSTRKTAIPQMFMGGVEEIKEKQGEGFEEWDNFLTDLEEQVDEPSAANHTTPPAKSFQVQPPPPQQEGEEEDWNSFIQELDTQVTHPSEKEEHHSVTIEEPGEKKEAKTFQGRGLMLDKQEIKREEQTKREGRLKTPRPSGIPSPETQFTPTIRRAQPPHTDKKDLIPRPKRPEQKGYTTKKTVAPSAPSFTPAQFDAPAQHETQKAPATSVPAAIPQTAQTEAVEHHKPKKKKSKALVWIMLLAIIGGGGYYGYTHKEQLIKIKDKISASKPQHEKDFEKLKNELDKNKHVKAALLSEDLIKLENLLAELKDKQKTEKTEKNIRALRKKIITQAKDEIQKIALEKAGKSLVELYEYLDDYKEIKEIQSYIDKELRKKAQQQYIIENNSRVGYEKGIIDLIKIYGDYPKINHRELKTIEGILCYIERDIVGKTSKNQYEHAIKKMESYLTKAKAMAPTEELLAHIKLITRHVKEENFFWKQLEVGLKKMSQHSRKGKVYTIKYYGSKKKIYSVKGKIKFSSHVFTTKGEIQVVGKSKKTIQVKDLTLSTITNIIKVAGKYSSKKTIYRYAILLYSQGNEQKAEQGFKRLKKISELAKRQKYSKLPVK